MFDGIIHSVQDHLLYVFRDPRIVVVIIAVLPVVEARLAIPIAFGYGLGAAESLIWAFLGSSLVVPLLLLWLIPFIRWLSEGVFRKAGKAVYSHLQTKAAGISSGCKPNAALTERKKIAGVFAFVAVPLPMTGVWTGSAVACIAGLNYRKALFAVTAGNFVASLIVTLLTFFFKDYVNYIIAGFCACALAAAAVTASKLLRKPKKNV